MNKFKTKTFNFFFISQHFGLYAKRLTQWSSGPRLDTVKVGLRNRYLISFLIDIKVRSAPNSSQRLLFWHFFGWFLYFEAFVFSCSVPSESENNREVEFYTFLGCVGFIPFGGFGEPRFDPRDNLPFCSMSSHMESIEYWPLTDVAQHPSQMIICVAVSHGCTQKIKQTT